MRITPRNITELKPNEIFVFGSNLSGIHGGGAARTALDKFGAVYGQAYGLQGNAFAIPTKSEGIKRTLLTREIKPYVDNFIHFAKSLPHLTFLVTEIGCGLAGYTPEDIAPLFKDAINIENIYLPETFLKILNK